MFHKLSLYNIRAQSSYPWEKKKPFFATNKILGKKAFVHCIRTRKGGALACTCPIQCRLRLMFGNSSSMTLLPSRQTVLHHGALVLGWWTPALTIRNLVDNARQRKLSPSRNLIQKLGGSHICLLHIKFERQSLFS